MTKNLSKRKNESDEDLDSIWSVVEELQKISLNKNEQCSALIQIHTSAVTLWNLAVGMKTEGSGNLTWNAKCKKTFDEVSQQLFFFAKNIRL